MTGGQSVDGELKEHLAACAECAIFAGAEMKLADAFQLLKSENVETATSLGAVRQRVETEVADFSRKENPVMSTFRNSIRLHPRLSVGVAAAVVLFLFVTLVPFSYERTIGYTATVSVPASGAGVVPQNLRAALESLGHRDIAVNVNQTNNNTTFEMGRFPTRLAAREAATALTTLIGRQADINVSPVLEKVSGSLYAQVRDQIVTIRIEAAGKSDAELSAEIAQQLEQNGFAGANVSVTTTPDGMRNINISHSAESENGGRALEVQMKQSPGDGSGINSEPISINLLQCDSTLTDEQLKAEIETRLAQQGITDVQVQVTRDADGKRDVRVEARK